MPTDHPASAASKAGLVLPGGGARAAYQVGVLRAVADLLPPRAANPFPVITGTSAGAVNATALAIHADRFRVAVGNLDRVWRSFHVDQVFRADTISMLRNGLRWLLALVSGGWLLPPPPSLFDNAPLRELLRTHYDFAGIRRSLASGHLDALAIAAACYSTARSVSFYDSAGGHRAWTRVRRAGEPTVLTLDHLMASVAIPFLFPPSKIGEEYYGDGAMRQATPLSAAIHLGAERLLVIGTRSEASTRHPPPTSPSFGQIFGYMLDGLFMDGLHSDFERLTQINHVVGHEGPVRIGGHELKRIDMLVILPSRDLSEVAREHARALPRSLRVLLRTMGAMNASGSDLMSYLMFEESYTRELISIGFRDAMRREQDLRAFLGGAAVVSSGVTAELEKLALGEEESAESKQ